MQNEGGKCTLYFELKRKISRQTAMVWRLVGTGWSLSASIKQTIFIERDALSAECSAWESGLPAVVTLVGSPWHRRSRFCWAPHVGDDCRESLLRRNDHPGLRRWSARPERSSRRRRMRNREIYCTTRRMHVARTVADNLPRSTNAPAMHSH